MGPLSVAVERSPGGPLLSAADPAIEPLAFVVNSAFGGVLEGLEEHLVADVSLSRHGVFALRRGDVDGEPPGADAWKALTGQEPGEDAYLVGAEFLRRSLLVPRQVLLGLLAALRERRAAAG